MTVRVRYHLSRVRVTIVWSLWRHRQSIVTSSAERTAIEWDTGIILILASFIDSLCRVRNKTMCVLSWQTVSALTRVLFWCLFPSLLRNSGNKHQNNPASRERINSSPREYINYSICIFRPQWPVRKKIYSSVIDKLFILHTTHTVLIRDHHNIIDAHWFI